MLATSIMQVGGGHIIVVIDAGGGHCHWTLVVLVIIAGIAIIVG